MAVKKPKGFEAEKKEASWKWKFQQNVKHSDIQIYFQAQLILQLSQLYSDFQIKVGLKYEQIIK